MIEQPEDNTSQKQQPNGGVRLVLGNPDRDVFLAALEHPPELAEGMRKAGKLHETLIIASE